MLPATAIDRLVKLCGMFGSAHDGERAAAALKADQLVRNNGCTWSDVIRPGVEKRSGRQSRPDPSWKVDAEFCQEHAEELNDWEDSFIDSILSQARDRLSDKQKETLERIVEKLRRRGH